MESNNSPEIPDMWETSDIPTLPSGGRMYDAGTVGQRGKVEGVDSVTGGWCVGDAEADRNGREDDGVGCLLSLIHI